MRSDVFLWLSLILSFCPHGAAVPEESKMEMFRKQLDTTGCDYEERFYASQHLPEIAEYVRNWNGPRTTAVLDFYNGAGNFKKVAVHRGHDADNFDCANDRTQNVCIREGFFKGLDKILQVILWGLIMWGPPCSLWIWLSSSVHMRTCANPAGNLGNNLVQISNLIAENTSVLMVVAWQRLTNQVLEQPKGSYYLKYETPAWVFQTFGWPTVTTWMIFFNSWAPKPSKLVGSLPSIGTLRRVYSKKSFFLFLYIC